VRFAVFITVLVMGPVFLGLSFWLAAYILALTRGAGVDEQVFTGLARLARATPALHRNCRFRGGLLAGAIAK